MGEELNRPIAAKRNLNFGQKAALTILSPILIGLLIILIPFLLVAALAMILHRLVIGLIVRLTWVPKGRFLLITHSNSPVWSPYVNDNLIPALSTNAVLLNWSERKKWSKRSLSTHAFYAFAGGVEHTPSVILFDSWWKPKVYRFWKPFRSYKHGRPQEVDQLRTKLETDIQQFVNKRKIGKK